LSLTGQVLPIRGAIAMALALRRDDSGRCLLLPEGNGRDAMLIDDVRWRPGALAGGFPGPACAASSRRRQTRKAARA
jgi:hypothetical protein